MVSNNSKMQVKFLRAFNDNYIWLIIKGNSLVVVDPGESQQVLDYIVENNLDLKAMLITHGHRDHIGGVGDILALYPVPVYGRVDLATHIVKEDDVIEFDFGVSFSVLDTQGHTFDGVSYFCESNDGSKHLFCGDTLFGAGCGRVFTEDYQLMYASLIKIKHLHPSTLIYPAHEYTLQNLNFARYIEPDNLKITERLLRDMQSIQASGITLPTVLSVELETNVFLRCDRGDVMCHIERLSGIDISDDFICFTQMRWLKNKI